jgi:endoglycosylceramidase
MSHKVLICIFLSLAFVATQARVRVDRGSKFMADEFNHSLHYHGVNVVYKLPPFYPPADAFDANYSLADQDLENLNNWGQNVIRLHLAWEGVEPLKGQYNLTYLETIRSIVRRAAKYNISVIIDAHQDAWGRRLCGEGMPDWATKNDTFPFPLFHELDYDDQGFPTIESCLKVGFAAYYFSRDVSTNFQRLYDNVDGLRDSFGAFWKLSATYFKDEPNVIGYELLNEPWWGDIYADFRSVYEPNTKNLMPLYRELHKAIREVDNDTIILFEPVTTSFLGIGFVDGPGGQEYNDRQVLGYHVYCMSNDAHGDPTSRLICEVMDRLVFAVHRNGEDFIGIPGFITEFGAVTASDNGITELKSVTDKADESFQSWAYWQFKWFGDFTTADSPPQGESLYDLNGQLLTKKMEVLAKPYFYSTCGTPKSYNFDHDAKTLKFKYTYNKCGDRLSEFYASSDFHYQNGVSATVDCTGCTIAQLDANHYSISHPETLEAGQIVTVRLNRK